MGRKSRITVLNLAQPPVLAGKYQQQRAAPRKILRLPAWIVFYRASLKKHVAMVRDMTGRGIFFYSEFRPAVGDEIEFVLKFPKWTNTGVFACKGKVVRVEQPVPDACPGVAVSLNRFMLWK